MLLVALLTACPADPDATDKASGDTAVELGVDTDGDGVPDSADCDPNDPFVYPGAPELPYNDVDEDCDGVALMDVDGDGHDGVRGGGDDCDDSNPTINPSHIEICYDALDNNCDGWEGGTDCDGDGYPLGGDCWDDEEDLTFANPAGLKPVDVFPGAPDEWYDGTDADCGLNDDYDQDADGEASSAYTGGDCNDLDPRVGTAMEELWNGFDDDCDGVVDAMVPSEAFMRVSGSSGDGEADFGTAVAFVPDLDGDGGDDLVVGMGASDEYAGGAWILPIEAGIVTPVTESLGALSGTGGTGTSLARTSVTGSETLAVGSPWGESTGAVDFYDLGSIADGAAVARVEQAGGGGTLFSLGDGRLLIGCTYGATTMAMSTWASVAGTQTLNDADFSVTSQNLACTTSATLGDLDGDGLDELFVAAYDEDGNNYAYLADGAVQLAGGRVPTSSLGSMGNPAIGLRYGTLGDLDGNGYDEAIITDTSYDANSSGDGRSWVIDGEDFSASWTTAARTTVSGGVVGAALRPGTLGDVDGDGVTDLLFGSTGTAVVGFISSTDLNAGGSLTPAVQTPGFSDSATSSLFGDAAWAHDYDHDGDIDVLVRTGRSPGGLYLFQHQ
jgi:hypothetical protein